MTASAPRTEGRGLRALLQHCRDTQARDAPQWLTPYVAAGEAAAAPHRMLHRGAVLTHDRAAQRARRHETACPRVRMPHAVINHIVRGIF